MRVLVIGSLLLAGMVAPAVAAQTPPSKPIVVTGKPLEDPDKVVCKKNKTTETGSRLRGRGKTCMRAIEWAQLDQANEAFKQGLIDRPPHAADAAMISPDNSNGSGSPE